MKTAAQRRILAIFHEPAEFPFSRSFGPAGPPGVRACFSLALAGFSVWRCCWRCIRARRRSWGNIALASPLGVVRAGGGWVGGGDVGADAGAADATALDRLPDGIPRFSRAGWIYLGGTLLVALAALNTGNNLVVSGAGLPDRHDSDVGNSFFDFAFGRGDAAGTAGAYFCGANGARERSSCAMRSSCCRVFRCAWKQRRSRAAAPAMLETPVFFPYFAATRAGEADRANDILTARAACQDTFRIVTRFPFGFLQKTRRVDLKSEALVYPSVETSSELVDIFAGIEGAWRASQQRPRAGSARAARVCSNRQRAACALESFGAHGFADGAGIRARR